MPSKLPALPRFKENYARLYHVLLCTSFMMTYDWKGTQSLIIP